MVTPTDRAKLMPSLFQWLFTSKSPNNGKMEMETKEQGEQKFEQVEETPSKKPPSKVHLKSHAVIQRGDCMLILLLLNSSC